MRAEDGGIYRKSAVRDFRKRYFLAFEGYSEYNYFRGLKNCRNAAEVRISRDVDLQCLDRNNQNSRNSNPRNIQESLDDYRRLIRTGDYSVELFVYSLIQDVYSHFCSKLIDAEKKNCLRKLYGLQTQMIGELYSSDYVKGRFIDESEWESATEFCRKIIDKSEFRGCSKYISVPKNRKISTYDETLDAFCLIADRDSKSNPAKHYMELISICSEKNIRLFITNPCFEFWLLLHYPAVLNYNTSEYESLRANDKIEVNGKRRTYCECKLLEQNENYSKIDVDFRRDYLDKFTTALENAHSFESDLKKLESNLGTNIHLLIQEMRER